MSFVKNGLNLPGDKEDKCCWCLPINIGVILIGLGFIGWAFRAIQFALLNIQVGGSFLIWGILYAVCSAPMVLASLMFLKFCKDRNATDGREGMEKGCTLTVLGLVALSIVTLISGIVNGSLGLSLNYVISFGIDGLVYLYFLAVCKRFTSQL